MNGKRRISILLRYLQTFVVYLVVKFFKHVCVWKTSKPIEKPIYFATLSCCKCIRSSVVCDSVNIRCTGLAVAVFGYSGLQNEF